MFVLWVERGNQKLKDRWNSGPYIVVEKLPNLPVHRVKPERGKGVVKTLHRNHLLPIGYLVRLADPAVDDGYPKPTDNRVARTRQQKLLRNEALIRHTDQESLASDEDESSGNLLVMCRS